jgi:ferredoxin-thioredoxin reductase catalytic subunit/glutaredoxin
MNEIDVEYEYTDVDLLHGDEKKAILEEVKKHNPRLSYPTIIIGDTVIVGHKEQEIKDALGIVSSKEVEELYERLKKINEPKGYLFNKDKKRTLELIEGLIVNKNRYGYMACPCRLAADDRDFDKDIICPCDYREPDVEEYGSCYCNLYVSEDWNEGRISHEYVPERRPDDKFSL